ncbi:MAG: endonuclease/exonuclease/phosphatase family protein, partial [Thermoleophilaceae bacterium]|nr:endonuclease/exonuclease/phosphatase family protein [Thermoleophilaceae bacterium]
WNLYHGRDRAPERGLHTWRSRLLRTTERGARYAQVNRPLLAEFATLIDSWEWDVALLQEAPPPWLAPLARRCGASGALALTSRNTLAPLRAAFAALNPDLIASNEGGSNIVLVRAPRRIVALERLTLAHRPERRRLLLARVDLGEGARCAVACVHLSVPETGQGAGEVLVAAERAVGFAGGDPLVLGGDLNLRPSEEPAAFAELERRYGLERPTAPRSIDHVLARGLDVLEAPRALPAAARQAPGPHGLALQLSDHAPVIASFGMR